MEELVRKHFGPVLDEVPGIVVVVLASTGDEHLVALGDLASLPQPRSSCWEIASITKGFTGMLLAEMSLRGEVGLDDPIGAHLSGEVAQRLPAPELQPTLEDLATHHAGLPSIPLSWLMHVRGADPYSRLSEAMVFRRLGPRTRRPRRPKFRYSNFGMGLLGHVLEQVADQPYAELLRERLLDPLGLVATGVGNCGAASSDVVQGVRRRKPTPAWTFGALDGCGAIRSTPEDLTALARSLLDPPTDSTGEAITLATQARRNGPARNMQIGLGWLIRSDEANDVVWHNGGTYATSSFLAADRRRSTALVALGNRGPRLTPRLDAASWALLDDLEPSLRER